MQTKNKGHKERKKNNFFRNRQRKIIFNNVAKRSFKKVFVFRFVDNRILIINLNDFFRLFVLNKIIFKLPKNIPQCKTVEQRFFASRKFLKFFLGKKKNSNSNWGEFLSTFFDSWQHKLKAVCPKQREISQVFF